MESKLEGLDLDDKAIHELGAVIGESWQHDHDRAMSCRDFEELVKSCQALLEKLARGLAAAGPELSEEAWFDLDELVAIRGLCRYFSLVFDGAREKLAGFEREGYTIDGSAGFMERLQEINNVLIPLKSFLEDSRFRLVPVSAREVPVRPPAREIPAIRFFGTFDPSVADRVDRGKKRQGDPLLPDPPLETPEQSTPFDLPLLGPRVRVKARPGLLRLPDPIDD